jgi:hypothetical protein
MTFTCKKCGQDVTGEATGAAQSHFDASGYHPENVASGFESFTEGFLANYICNACRKLEEDKKGSNDKNHL